MTKLETEAELKKIISEKFGAGAFIFFECLFFGKCIEVGIEEIK